LPALLLTLVAGHVADRLHRARIVLVCLLVQGLVALVLMAATEGLFALGPWASRELLLGLSVALGAARAFQMPAQQALMPQLVPPDLLSRAMAFSAGGMQTAVIGGPALGGLIFVAGATAVYASSAGLFFVGCVLMSRVRYVHLPPPDEPVTMRSLLAGLVFVWQRKALLGAVSLDLFAVLLGGATALLPLFAKDILMVGPWGLGLLRAAPAVGAVLMSALLTRWPMQRRVGHRMLGAVAVYGVCMVVFGLSTSFTLSLLVLALSGAAAISHDLWSSVIRKGHPKPGEELKVARLATIGLALVAIALGVAFKGQNVAFMVGLAFAIAASANFPALVLSVFWRRTSTAGAAASMVVGTTATLVLIALSPAVQIDLLHKATAIVPLKNPALVTIPLSFLTGIVVSLLLPDENGDARYEALEARLLLGSDQ
jgi:MFS family permease